MYGRTDEFFFVIMLDYVGVLVGRGKKNVDANIMRRVCVRMESGMGHDAVGCRNGLFGDRYAMMDGMPDEAD